jgi:hypothetical protein
MKNILADLLPKFDTPDKGIKPFQPYKVSLPDSPDINPQLE